MRSYKWHPAADFLETAPNGRDLAFDVELQRSLQAGQKMTAEEIEQASKAATTVPPSLEELYNMRKCYAKWIQQEMAAEAAAEGIPFTEVDKPLLPCRRKVDTSRFRIQDSLDQLNKNGKVAAYKPGTLVMKTVDRILKHMLEYGEVVRQLQAVMVSQQAKELDNIEGHLSLMVDDPNQIDTGVLREIRDATGAIKQQVQQMIALSEANRLTLQATVARDISLTGGSTMDAGAQASMLSKTVTTILNPAQLATARETQKLSDSLAGGLPKAKASVRRSESATVSKGPGKTTDPGAKSGRKSLMPAPATAKRGRRPTPPGPTSSPSDSQQPEANKQQLSPATKPVTATSPTPSPPMHTGMHAAKAGSPKQRTKAASSRQQPSPKQGQGKRKGTPSPGGGNKKQKGQ